MRLGNRLLDSLQESGRLESLNSHQPKVKYASVQRIWLGLVERGFIQFEEAHEMVQLQVVDHWQHVALPLGLRTSRPHYTLVRYKFEGKLDLLQKSTYGLYKYKSIQVFVSKFMHSTGGSRIQMQEAKD